METRNIFLDASVFIGQNYNYKSAVFENLERLVKAGKANVFVTDITIQEVRSHIKEDVAKAEQAHGKFRKDAKIYRNIELSPYKELFTDIPVKSTVDELYKQLDDFLNGVDATVLSTTEVSIRAVFDKYFEKKPPFGSGKKKSEFPDAFAVEALENWCKENGEKIYVATTDNDLKSHCEVSDKLIAINKLSEFISLVEFHDEVLAPSIIKLIDKNIEGIEEAISESFCQQGFWIDDQEGEVNDVRVNRIELGEFLLLEIDRNSAVVQVDVEINFSADLTYDDLDTAIYDSEDKVLIPLHTIDKTVEQEVDFTSTIRLLHEVEENPDYLEIENVEIDTERGWGFSVSSDDEWPYK